MRDIIVIGGSAGGFDAIRKVVSGLPADLCAAVFVTIHVTSRSDGILPSVINRSGPLEAFHPADGDPIRPGRIYVAPPDHHLILRPGHIHLSHGPRENMQRPCINAMFRSAAASYGEQVAGVLLTGLLDDGAAGLWEIQQKNGATVVQDPAEAEFRTMPDSAIRGLNVQYIVRLAEMAPLLSRLAISDQNQNSRAATRPGFIGPAMQTCPECGGAMEAVRMGRLHEFRCHVGHSMGLQTMIDQKSGNIERALENALSQSEELSQLLKVALEDPDGFDPEDLKKEMHWRNEQQKVLRILSSNPKDKEIPEEPTLENGGTN